MKFWYRLSVALPFFGAGGISIVAWAEWSVGLQQSAFGTVPLIGLLFGYGWWKLSKLTGDP